MAARDVEEAISVPSTALPFLGMRRLDTATTSPSTHTRPESSVSVSIGTGFILICRPSSTSPFPPGPAEGAGAASVAAVLYDKFDTAGKVACVVSGGNIDVTTLQRILDQGLMKSGRMARIHTVIQDRPGHLAKLLAVISESGANVVSIQHDRTSSGSGIGMALLDLLLETNDFDHLNRVHELMKENGYPVM